MNDRDQAIILMADILARRDWEKIRKDDGFRLRAWEDMDFETRDAWAETRKDEAEHIVFLMAPYMRGLTNE